MRIFGLDLSLTATGAARPDGSTRTISTRAHGMPRLSQIRAAVLDEVVASGAQLVVVENYSFGSHMAHSHATGELGGVVRLALFDAGIPYVDVPPKTLKKFATGKGNARKEAMLTAAVRRLGYEGSSHDEADALWLRALAHAAYGTPIVSVPAVQHNAAITGVRWPAFPAEVAS